MTEKQARLLANVAIVHGSKAAEMLRDLMLSGDSVFATALAQAALDPEFLIEKHKVDQSKRRVR